MTFSNETARREFLIAPVLFQVARHLNAQLRVEYPLNVTPQLRGNLDHLLLTDNRFLVVEAKNADITRGFAPLSAEMAAMDPWVAEDTPLLYGAVSIGDTWQFGAMNRAEKTMTQDIGRFLVPENLESLLVTLIGILRGSDAVPN